MEGSLSETVEQGTSINSQLTRLKSSDFASLDGELVTPAVVVGRVGDFEFVVKRIAGEIKFVKIAAAERLAIVKVGGGGYLQDVAALLRAAARVEADRQEGGARNHDLRRKETDNGWYMKNLIKNV